MRFAVPILFFGVVACQRRITNANIDAVKSTFDRKNIPNGPGMSAKEVESILGQPDEVETFKIPLETQHKTLFGARYYYKQKPSDKESRRITLHFLEDKLVSAPSHFDEKPMGPPN